jgi:transketolase
MTGLADTVTMRSRFADTATELMRTHDRLAVVLADIGVAAFDAAIIRHRDRVVNVGIREQLMIGVAAGLALEGFRPIVHSYAPFLVERPFEQIKLDLGHQDVGAILVSIGASYDSAGEGRTHQSPNDVSLLASLPGWEIHVPGHPDEVDLLLRAAAGGKGRVYIRLSTETNAAPVPVESGRLALVRSSTGSRAPVVIAVGPTLDRVLEATGERDVTVVYAATVRPFDHATLRRVASSGEVVLVEPYLEGTSAHEVSVALADRPHRLRSVGVPRKEHRRYGTRFEHAAAHGLDAPGIRRTIDEFLAA